MCTLVILSQNSPEYMLHKELENMDSKHRKHLLMPTWNVVKHFQVLSDKGDSASSYVTAFIRARQPIYVFIQSTLLQEDVSREGISLAVSDI